MHPVNVLGEFSALPKIEIDHGISGPAIPHCTSSVCETSTIPRPCYPFLDTRNHWSVSQARMVETSRQTDLDDHGSFHAALSRIIITARTCPIGCIASSAASTSIRIGKGMNATGTQPVRRPSYHQTRSQDTRAGDVMIRLRRDPSSHQVLADTAGVRFASMGWG